MLNGMMLFRTRSSSQGIAGLTSLLAVCFVLGCGKQDPPAPQVSTSPATDRVLLTTHWIGRTRLAQDTNSAYQMEIWNLPESKRVEAQTLDKLARALPRLLGAETLAGSNDLGAVIRPLLDDLIQAESFSELRAATNQSKALALAIRLAPERMAVWQTNISVLNAALTHPQAGTGAAPARLRFGIQRDWLILGAGGDGTLFAEFERRFGLATSSITATNHAWVEIGADLSRLLEDNSMMAASALPFLSLTLGGKGQLVETHGELTFPQPLQLQLEAWNIPTNLVYEPLISFTVMRGLKGLLESSRAWSDLKASPAPGQLCTWAVDGTPFQTYLSAPWSDSSNQVFNLSERLLQDLNPYLTSNRLGLVTRLAGTNGIEWGGIPFFGPFLKHHTDPAPESLFGGFYAFSPGKRPMPEELLIQTRTQTNLLYYDWELTGPRLTTSLHIGQLLRMVAGKAQFERDSPVLQWLLALSSSPADAVTAVSWAGPTKLSVKRRSITGFTAIELQFIADWLDSPDFPVGLHTFRAPVKPALRRKSTSHPEVPAGPAPAVPAVK